MDWSEFRQGTWAKVLSTSEVPKEDELGKSPITQQGAKKGTILGLVSLPASVVWLQVFDFPEMPGPALEMV